MSVYVIKFGGTSVATHERIHHAASIVRGYYEQNHQVVVVVSAMAGTTNQLISYVKDITGDAYPCYSREYDMVAAAGEQITAGLMALALQRLGCQAHSLLGFQIPIETDTLHGQGSIHKIQTDTLEKMMNQGAIPVVAGFQGVYHNNGIPHITTLGRGGSDTTAVALAAALKAERCYIYTDVEGVYTADPRFVKKARKLSAISHKAMLELAAQGAKVLHYHSAALAMRYNVELCVLSSFSNNPGTIVNQFLCDASAVDSISHHTQKAYVVIDRCADMVGILEKFPALEGVHYHNKTLSFLIDKSQVDQLTDYLITTEAVFTCNPHIATLTLVGPAIHEKNQVMLMVLHTLRHHGIDIIATATTTLSIMVVISYVVMQKALVVLHEALLEDTPLKIT